nr:MAG: hypothetical protein DIU64_11890 [Caldicoprobacter oshimai]
MDKEMIAKKVHSVVVSELKDIPFDKALLKLRKVLWDIADEFGIDGADVFKIYMDWISKNEPHH